MTATNRHDTATFEELLPEMLSNHSTAWNYPVANGFVTGDGWIDIPHLAADISEHFAADRSVLPYLVKIRKLQDQLSEALRPDIRGQLEAANSKIAELEYQANLAALEPIWKSDDPADIAEAIRLADQIGAYEDKIIAEFDREEAGLEAGKNGGDV